MQTSNQSKMSAANTKTPNQVLNSSFRVPRFSASSPQMRRLSKKHKLELQMNSMLLKRAFERFCEDTLNLSTKLKFEIYCDVTEKGYYFSSEQKDTANYDDLVIKLIKQFISVFRTCDFYVANCFYSDNRFFGHEFNSFNILRQSKEPDPEMLKVLNHLEQFAKLSDEDRYDAVESAVRAVLESHLADLVKLAD